MTMSKRYEIVDEEKVRLLEGPYAGMLCQYGEVSFCPCDATDTLTLKFQCYILEGETPNGDDFVPFRHYMGDILVELITEGLETGKIVFRSGMDENETRDQDTVVPSTI